MACFFSSAQHTHTHVYGASKAAVETHSAPNCFFRTCAALTVLGGWRARALMKASQASITRVKCHASGATATMLSSTVSAPTKRCRQTGRD